MERIIEKMTGESLNLEQDNIQKLKELFPSIVTDGKIDFDMLRTLLDGAVEESREKYQFTWNGKSKAIKMAQVPSTSTLRPCYEKSRDWDNTQNLYIEGDNFEVLKQLQKTYHSLVDVIYIDPPYNTGKDFVYKDNYENAIQNYIENTSQNVSSNPETSGRFHTDWLNMMYPRLLLGRNLLKEDGVIFISIDDNELANLKKICDEIFGEKNLIGIFKWNRVKKAPSLSSSIRTKYEYVLAYFRRRMPMLYGKASYNKQGPLWHLPNKKQELLFPAYSIRIKKSFPKGNYGGTYMVEVIDDLTEENGLNKNPVRIAACSAWGQEKINNYVEKGNTFEIKKEPTTMYTDLNSEENFIAPSDLINDVECSVKCNTDAAEEMKKMGIPFDYTKPVSLIEYLIQMVTYNRKNSLILDFFSGSSTSAHAVMSLNAKDEMGRKYIMVQIPELANIDVEGGKNEFNTLCDIGEERIRRAGEKIKKEWEEKNKANGLFAEDKEFPVDIGFKVFKLDSSNIETWDNERELNNEGLLQYSNEVFKEGRSKEDVLYEIMLKYGIFDREVSEIDINGKTMYQVGKRYMIVCLEDDLDVEDIVAIGERKPNTVVFKESGFKNDNDKINAVYNLKKQGVEDIKCI